MANEALYRERFARIQKAIRLEPVDRVPILFMGTAFAPRFMGLSMAEFCEDPEAGLRTTLAAMDRLDGVDGCNAQGIGGVAYLLSAVWLSRVAIPGKELPPEALWQVQEAEVMTPNDYDVILERGWGAFLHAYLPRIVDLAALGRVLGYMEANRARIRQLYRERGYVVVSDAPVFPQIPFEGLCGGRSMARFFLDLYRIPDRVQAVMDVILAETLAQVEAAPSEEGIIGGAWIGGWRSASALVSPKVWDRFVWPYCLKLVEALVAKGYTPVLHWDQDWSRDLVRLQELPPKRCVLNPDGMTDLRKFKELAGDRVAMMGDVPSALLATGTPEEVRAYVRDLIELFQGEGLLLCPGCDAPMNAKPENMRAYVAAGHEFGNCGAGGHRG